jgi:hypothetical protein
MGARQEVEVHSACLARETLHMPNDAKLGLVLGLSLAIAVAMVFFRRDLATAQLNDNPAGALGGAAGPPAASTTSPAAPPNAVPSASTLATPLW